MSLDLRPNRKYPNLPSITGDPASHRDALRAVTEALNIGQRRTSDILSSFIRVSDLVDLGLIELTGSSFATTPSSYTPSAHTHLLADVTNAGALAALNSLAHSATTGLGSDNHTQYILVAGTRAFTGTQTTLALLPSADVSYDLGDAATRYRALNAQRLRVVVATLPNAQHVSSVSGGGHVIARLQASSTGACTVSSASSLGTAITVGGARSLAAGTATVRSLHSGNYVFALADAQSTGAALVEGGGTANFVSGSATATNTTPATVRSDIGAQAAFVQGSAVSDAFSAEIFAGYGSFGCFVQGSAYGGASAALLSAGGYGSFAQGCAFDGGTISCGASGGFAQGYVEDGTIDCAGAASGGMAHGYASPGRAIRASALGATAIGYTSTADILASADNAVQFGPGTNAQADSMQIGLAGLRFKGTTGVPTTKQNGDHWMGGTGNAFVVVRSNAKDVQLNVGQAYTVNTYTTDRNLTNSATVTLAEVADVLATLINDLKTAGHLN